MLPVVYLFLLQQFALHCT